MPGGAAAKIKLAGLSKRTHARGRGAPSRPRRPDPCAIGRHPALCSRWRGPSGSSEPAATAAGAARSLPAAAGLGVMGTLGRAEGWWLLLTCSTRALSCSSSTVRLRSAGLLLTDRAAATVSEAVPWVVGGAGSELEGSEQPSERLDAPGLPAPPSAAAVLTVASLPPLATLPRLASFPCESRGPSPAFASRSS